MSETLQIGALHLYNSLRDMLQLIHRERAGGNKKGNRKERHLRKRTCNLQPKTRRLLPAHASDENPAPATGSQIEAMTPRQSTERSPTRRNMDCASGHGIGCQDRSWASKLYKILVRTILVSKTSGLTILGSNTAVRTILVLKTAGPNDSRIEHER